MIKNLPANAGGKSLIPGLGRFHMPQSVLARSCNFQGIPGIRLLCGVFQFLKVGGGLLLLPSLLPIVTHIQNEDVCSTRWAQCTERLPVIRGFKHPRPRLAIARAQGTHVLAPL